MSVPTGAVTPCRTSDDPDLWFSDRKAHIEIAVGLCNTCPFLAECREDGEKELFGVWGGVYRTTSVKQIKVLMAEENKVIMQERIDKVMRLHDKGLTAYQIHETLNLAQSSVYVALDRGKAQRAEETTA